MVSENVTLYSLISYARPLVRFDSVISYNFDSSPLLRSILDVNDFNIFCLWFILYLYQKFGFEKTSNDVDGGFSLIIYDTNTNNIYVGRDPYGVRPLFIGYYEHNYIFLSSELNSIHDLTSYTKQFTPGYYLEYDLKY